MIPDADASRPWASIAIIADAEIAPVWHLIGVCYRNVFVPMLSGRKRESIEVLFKVYCSLRPDNPLA